MLKACIGLNCARQIDYIDRRHCGLTFIPDDVYRHERTLEELLLDYNSLQELPPVSTRRGEGFTDKGWMVCVIFAWGRVLFGCEGGRGGGRFSPTLSLVNDYNNVVNSVVDFLKLESERVTAQSETSATNAMSCVCLESFHLNTVSCCGGSGSVVVGDEFLWDSTLHP